MKKTILLGVFVIGVFVLFGIWHKAADVSVKRVLIHPYQLNSHLNSESLILFEGNPNRMLWSIAEQVRDSLNRNPQVRAVLSRESANAALSDVDLFRYARQQRVDLVISLTLNTEIGRGFKVYYQQHASSSLKEDEHQLVLSKSFAAGDLMQRSMQRHLAGYVVDGGLVGESEWKKGGHLLQTNRSTIAVVQVELGNLTEQIESLFLDSQMGRSRIAAGVEKGISNYLQTY